MGLALATAGPNPAQVAEAAEEGATFVGTFLRQTFLTRCQLPSGPVEQEALPLPAQLTPTETQGRRAGQRTLAHTTKQ